MHNYEMESVRFFFKNKKQITQNCEVL